jgi:hypothetical protein
MDVIDQPLGSLTLQPDDEKKANLILSALRAEAKAELFYKKINYIYELSLKHRKTGKLISTKIPKGFNTTSWRESSASCCLESSLARHSQCHGEAIRRRLK